MRFCRGLLLGACCGTRALGGGECRLNFGTFIDWLLLRVVVCVNCCRDRGLLVGCWGARGGV